MRAFPVFEIATRACPPVLVAEPKPSANLVAEPMVAYLGNTLNLAANSRVGSIEHPKCLHNGSEGHLTPYVSCKLREKPFAGCVAA